MAKSETQVPAKKSAGQDAAGAAWAEWPSLNALRGEIDRLFEEFRFSNRFPFTPRTFKDLETLFPGPARSASPAVDIEEKDKEYELTAEVPGMDEKEIEIHVANGVLTIKGKKEERTEEKKKDYVFSERRFGSFERRMPLPEGIDPDRITATMKKGVLVLTLPKTAEAQKPQKKIEVTSAA